MKQKKQEKLFLERLGINMLWYDNSREICDGKNHIICIPYNMKIMDFICHLPELFLFSWRVLIFWIKSDPPTGPANQDEYKTCDCTRCKMIHDYIPVCEKATGKPFEQLLKLWEECKK